MLTLRPKKLIKISDLNDIAAYEIKSESCALIQKYILPIVEKLVSTLPNPLAVGLVRSMFDKEVSSLEKTLQGYITLMGQDNFEKVCRELLEQNYQSEAEFEQKLQSMMGEINTYRKISNTFKALRKINAIGDWGSDEILVSVKTLLSVDSNYQMIEGYLLSFFYIDDCEPIHKYNWIQIRHQTNVDYRFRDEVIDFLKFRLCSIVKELAFKDRAILEYTKKDKFKRVITIKGQNFDKKVLLIDISEQRTKDQSSLTRHGLGFRLKKMDIQDGISVSNDYGVYWEGMGFDWEKLKPLIIGNISKLEGQFLKVKDPTRFLGCIPVVVHPMYEDYVKDSSEKIQELLRELIRGKQFQIVICLLPQISFSSTKELCAKNDILPLR